MSTQKNWPHQGKLLDADGHLYLRPETIDEIFGTSFDDPTLAFLRNYVHTEEFSANRSRNREALWEVKGMGALGAFDPQERVEALNEMGIESQLLFPNTGCAELRRNSPEARAVASRYNDFALDFTRQTNGRARAACQINMSDVDYATQELERILSAGALCVTLPAHQPPSGVSPAHELWDPFWARLEEANVPATIHIGAGGLLACTTPDDLMFPDPNWGAAASLRNKPAFRAGGEEAISPYFMLVAHISSELFLQTMVMGKVFERFPNLRFGIIECGSAWLGPTCERMDAWAGFMSKVGVHYSMKPSEFVRRNVRVTPLWSENLPRQIERYGLHECYVFSTDFPHLEGSRDPIGKFRQNLRTLEPQYEADFFVENGRLLLPE